MQTTKQNTSAEPTCLTCGTPAQRYSSFCLECDGGNVAQHPTKKRVRCAKCQTQEAMPGRTVCEGCAN